MDPEGEYEAEAEEPTGEGIKGERGEGERGDVEEEEEPEAEAVEEPTEGGRKGEQGDVEEFSSPSPRPSAAGADGETHVAAEISADHADRKTRGETVELVEVDTNRMSSTANANNTSMAAAVIEKEVLQSRQSAQQVSADPLGVALLQQPPEAEGSQSAGQVWRVGPVLWYVVAAAFSLAIAAQFGAVMF